MEFFNHPPHPSPRDPEAIYREDGELLAKIMGPYDNAARPQIAAEIVRRWNCHVGLVEALEAILAMEIKGHSLLSRLQFSTPGRELAAKACEAMAKATGGAE